MRKPVAAALLVGVVVMAAGVVGLASAEPDDGTAAACVVGADSTVCTVPHHYIDVPGPTVTETVTATPEPGPTVTVTTTATATVTAEPSPSSTPTPTPTVSPTPPASATPTPTPSPTPTDVPAGFPDETTTGVPKGTTLRRVPQDVKSGPGWSYDSRGWVTITGNGAVFEGYDVSVDVSVQANNVVIRNNRIRSGGWPLALRHTTGTVIDRNTLGGTAGSTCDNAIRGIYGDDQNVTITANDIAYCGSGINSFSGGGLIQGNYIHDIGWACSGSGCLHYNGIQLSAGTGPLMVIDHNTILNTQGQTDAIMLANDEGAQRNRLITNNLLAGGGYCFYGAGGPNGVSTGITFRGNRFSTRYFPNCGYWGPVAYWKGSSSGNVWDDNRWADGPKAGQLINP